MPVAIRLLTLAVAQLLDFGTFVPMVRWDGYRTEANPFVAAMLVDYGLPLVAVAKIALFVIVSAVVVILARSPRWPRALAGPVLWAGIIAGIIGGASNAAILLH